MKTKKPKKFKTGKIEIWCNFTFNSIRYVVNCKGEGEYTYMGNDISINKWYPNTISRDVLNSKCGDEFMGYL